MFFWLKIVFFAGFLALIVYTWATQDTPFLIITGVNLIIVPILSIIYSYMIFNMKCMATTNTNRVRGRNANGGRLGGPRLADAADLDE